jgi:hypothetical protein
MFQIIFVENIKTRISSSETFFCESRCFRDYVENYGTVRQATDGDIIRRIFLYPGQIRLPKYFQSL